MKTRLLRRLKKEAYDNLTQVGGDCTGYFYTEIDGKLYRSDWKFVPTNSRGFIRDCIIEHCKRKREERHGKSCN